MRRPLSLLFVLALGACDPAPVVDDAGVPGADAGAIVSDDAGDLAPARDGGTDAGVPDAGSDAGAPDAGTDPARCTLPGDTLIDGSFDDGLDGLAPPGWQVRDPGAPARCGDPTEHVYAIDPPPGCGGRALAMDARGEWDCYAIQVFTDYGTIEGGATYRLGVTARATGRENPAGWFFLGLQWLDGSDAVFGDEKNPRVEVLSFDWQRVEFDVVAPPNARRAVVWLSAHYDGRVDVDALSMVRAP